MLILRLAAMVLAAKRTDHHQRGRRKERLRLARSRSQPRSRQQRSSN
jgi:hypothetical protein